ncbi:hypothetical protein ABZ079_35610 [Streptomyces sp. NPDC006314]
MGGAPADALDRLSFSAFFTQVELPQGQSVHSYAATSSTRSSNGAPTASP